ncbi:VOC family protein [Mycobacterium sp. Dal123C01]|uniref:VOC family protein n=1 Tax=Mycobacterium sp. Dal123C01 TaxID=3457577 RepID=UPI00403E79EB
MIDHIGINCADYPKSQAFYDTVLAVLGFSRQLDFGEAIGYGRDGEPTFWIADGTGLGPNRETHIAFAAADENAVRAFHEAALGKGAESLHEPRLWPEYHSPLLGSYFGAFVRDPDGNNVEAVYHGAP